MDEIYNADGERITTVNHAMMDFTFPCELEFPENTIIRLPTDEAADKVII